MRSSAGRSRLFAKCDPAYGAGVAGALKLERAVRIDSKAPTRSTRAQEKSARNLSMPLFIRYRRGERRFPYV